MGWVENTGRLAKPVRGVAWNHVLGRKDSTKAFATVVEADAWWRKREAEIQATYNDAGVDKPRQQRGVPTLAEFGRAYLSSLDLENSTLARNISDLHTLITRYFGDDMKVSDVTKAHVKDMLLSERNRGNGPSGRRNKLVALRKVMQGAIDAGYRTDDPTHGIASPTVPKKQARILTTAEIAALQLAMPPWLSVAVLLLSHAGLRISECCGLQRHNVDFDNAQITVQHTLDDRGYLRPYPKGKIPLPVPMSSTLLKALKDHMTERDNDTGYLLFNERHNVPVRPASLRKYLYRACEDAKIAKPRPTPHDLRHTAATLLARAGAQAYDIQAVLRHQNLATSQRYIASVPNAGRAALSRAFGEDSLSAQGGHPGVAL